MPIRIRKQFSVPAITFAVLIAPCQAATNEVLLRAVGPHIDPSVITYIADTAVPNRLSSTEGNTPRQVINVICGSYWPEYFEAFRKINALPGMQLDSPLPTEADTYQWPACLYMRRVEGSVGVSSEAAKVLTKDNGSNSTALYQALTGGDGTASAVSHFFSAPERFVTATVPIILPDSISADEFVGKVKTLAIGSHVGANPAAYIRSYPATDKSKGEIVVPVEAGGMVQGAESAVCEGSISTPFDTVAISNAYGFEHDTRPNNDSVSVGIVDNGFFGARPGSPPAFGDYFPGGFFGDWPLDLGPPVSGSSGNQVWPINYLNQNWTQEDIDEVSGHGTHVAGLILGGPYLKEANGRPIFFHDGVPWIKLAIANVGNGQEQLIDGAQTQFEWILSQMGSKGMDIVNMSISYDGDEAKGIGSTFVTLFDHNPSRLFVVAAGNYSSPDVMAEQFYPAALGGDTGLPNVITVAAHDSDDVLTSFTDRGAAVDIAAPGCGIRSWVDESGREATVSGTSQAAPFVTFAAALIKSLAGKNMQPVDVKRRIIASGDLLQGPDYQSISSWSKLDIRDSLFLFHDFLRTQKGKTKEEWLGTFDSIRSRCAGNRPDRGLGNVWSYKWDNGRSVLFFQKSENDIAPCNVTTGGTVSFSGTAQIMPGGKVQSLAQPQSLNCNIRSAGTKEPDPADPVCYVDKLVVRFQQ